VSDKECAYSDYSLCAAAHIVVPLSARAVGRACLATAPHGSQPLHSAWWLNRV
jgi:hypothetical protein